MKNTYRSILLSLGTLVLFLIPFTIASTIGTAYNTKDATPYIERMQSRKSHLRRLQGNNNKDNNKNNDKTPSTSAPTAGPTRAPVTVPWLSEAEGQVLLKVSLFTYESENLHLVEDRRLTRLGAADILNGSHDDLISDVVSSMADIICDSTERLKILSVVDGVFYDYCGMLALADEEETELDKSQFEIQTDLFSSRFTYMVTDFTDADTGLLRIEDRRVFISGEGGTRSEGGYLHWTVWSVSYPILQLGSTLNVTSEAQGVSDRVFATAVSNDVMDDLLEVKSEKVLVTSLEGWEVETFVRAIDEFKGAEEEEDIDLLENTSPTKDEYFFWQPIRIVGFALMGVLMASVGVLMLVGHERYKYDVWDATAIGKQMNDKEAVDHDHDLTTCEGLDFILHSGHQMRKESNANETNASLALSDPSDDGQLMQMGNTLSEIMRPAVQNDVPSASTPRPVASSARAMSNLLMKTFGFQPSGSSEGNQSDTYSQKSSTTSDQGQGTGTPTRNYGGGFKTPNALLPSVESPEGSPEDFFNKFVENQSAPTLPDLPSPSTPVGRRLLPLRKGKQEPEVSTPEHAERVRPYGSDDGDYAFVSVTSKKHPDLPSPSTPVGRRLLPLRKCKQEPEVSTPEHAERVRPYGSDDGDYAFVSVTSKKHRE